MNYQQALDTCLQTQIPPLRRHILDNGQAVWVRRQNSGNPRIYYKILNFITKSIFHLPILQAAYVDKKQAIADEAHRLQALEKENINAPRLLAYNPSGLMMSDITHAEDAQTLADLMQQCAEQHQSPLAIWQNALQALIALHAKRQYLSQAFIRNILFVDEQWFFIDFEEDPARILSIAECQVRDYLLFLHSSAYFFADEMPQAVAFWQQVMQQHAEDVRMMMQNTWQKIAKLHRLCFIQHLGRDGYRLAQAMRFIHMSHVNLQ